MTDRMDYLSPMTNNMVYIMAVEKLLGIDITPRAQTIRVILAEISRISSHLVWLGTHALDLAAMSVFLYCFREREYLLDIYEMVAGQRMMVSYFRPGGLWRDVPDEFVPAVRHFLDFFPAKIADYEALLDRNPIFLSRTQGVGVISYDQAIAWGVSGPSMRGSGVDWDNRRDMPYGGYEQYDFAVPVEQEGDVYARYRCRMREFRESLDVYKRQPSMSTSPAAPPARRRSSTAS